MASLVLTLLLGGVTLLATKELVESRVRGRIEQVRERRPNLAAFRSRPFGPLEAVKGANSGDLGLGTGVPRLRGTMQVGVNEQPVVSMKNPVSGRDFGQLYFLPEQFR